MKNIKTFCENCGKEILDEAVYCVDYGETMTNDKFDKKLSNKIAIAGFVCACIPVFAKILGLIFSIIGLKRAKEYGNNRKDYAIAGIVISALWIILIILINIID